MGAVNRRVALAELFIHVDFVPVIQEAAEPFSSVRNVSNVLLEARPREWSKVPLVLVTSGVGAGHYGHVRIVPPVALDGRADLIGVGRRVILHWRPIVVARDWSALAVHEAELIPLTSAIDLTGQASSLNASRRQ